MKKIMVVMLAVLMMGCANSIEGPRGEVVESYGLLNSEKRVDGVKYSICYGNLILGIVFCETVIAPVYFFGFSIKEPDCIDRSSSHSVRDTIRIDGRKLAF